MPPELSSTTPQRVGQLLDGSIRFARVLQSEGLQRGDRVALYLDNTAQCAAAIFGTLIAGGAFTFVNPQTKAEKLAFILSDSEAAFLVAEAHSAAVAARAVAEAPSVRRVYSTAGVDLPPEFEDLGGRCAGRGSLYLDGVRVPHLTWSVRRTAVSCR